MADSTEGDTRIQYLGFLVPALIGLIAGLVIHSFIIGVNVTDWWKGRSVTPVDLIVTSLAISRMGAQCVITLHVALVFLKNLGSLLTVIIINGIYNVFSYANIWLTSLLSIVLCLKISNFHTRLFLYLRGMIVHRTVYLIGAAVLLSVFSCIILSLEVINEMIKNGKYNRTMDNSSIDCTSNNYMHIYVIRTFFPFIFYYISSVLLFTSLYHHTTKMKMSSNLTINLETYYSLMKYVSFTFIYSTGYLIVDVAFMFYFYFHCIFLLQLHVVLGFVPILHSSFLIYRTAKLRNQMSKVLQDVTDFLFQRKVTETRENIEVVTL